MMNDFRNSYPIDFRLFDKDSQDVLYIEDTSDQQLTLLIENLSAQDIKLRPLAGGVSPTNYHFALLFRCGTLSESSLQGENCVQLTDQSRTDWEMTAPQLNVDGMDVMYLKHTSSVGQVLQQKPSKPGIETKTMTVNLRHLGADARGGARGTRVMLHSTNMSFPNGPDFDNYREIHLGIINHRGKKNIPLQMAFAGGNAVVNDGKASNKLQLRITNIARYDAGNPNSADIVFDKDTQFLLSFPTGDEFMLADISSIQGFSVYSPNGLKIDTTPSQQGEVIFWNISAPSGITLKSVSDPGKGNSFIDIEIDNITTNYATGRTNLYLHYKNIPGYWDGSFACEIEKSPVKIEGSAIEVYGFGTSDNAQLRIISTNEPVISFFGYNGSTKNYEQHLTIGAYGSENNIENYSRDLVIRKEKAEIARFTNADQNGDKAGLTVDGRIKSNGAGPGVFFGDNLMVGEAGPGYIGLYNKNPNDPQGELAWGLTMSNEGAVNITGKLGVGKKSTEAPTEQVDVNGNVKCAAVYLGNDERYALKVYNETVGFFNDYSEPHLLIDKTGLTTVNKLVANGDLTIKGKLFVMKVNKKPESRNDESPYLVRDKDSGEFYFFDSDERLKDSITSIPDALQNLLALRGVNYRWNEDGLARKTKAVEETYRSISNTTEDNERVWAEQKQRIRKENSKTFCGFIAQEVEALFPDWVIENEDGYKAINMVELAPVMVEAIKTQQQQIDALQTQMQQLLNEVEAIKACKV